MSLLSPSHYKASLESKQLFTRLIRSIIPLDSQEHDDIQQTLSWIAQEDLIFRIQPPDFPKRHLVVYFVVWDLKEKKILLVDHKKAKKWLPTGGHIECNEDPLDTVKRECIEELNVSLPLLTSQPFFLSLHHTECSDTTHEDVVLWYVLEGDSKKNYDFDAQEFFQIQWYALDQIPYAKADLHIKRFLEKWLSQESPISR